MAHRIRTQLEESLIKKGFKLIYKTYTGKHSQFIEYYVYSGSYKDYDIKIYLNSHRSKIISFTMNNGAFMMKDYHFNIDEFKNDYDAICEYIHKVGDELTDDEIVEIVEASENE